MEYIPTIGLEIHVELKTKSKMFCACKNDPLEKTPNTNICPVCLGYPGALPTINQEAIKKVIKTGLALNCQINRETFFERKSYFYPDLPKGYQISQYQKPLCFDGILEIELEGRVKKIRIRRIHLEEDTGRLIHAHDYSLIDFNRAGIPLMELVTEPDIQSALEARKFAEELQLILKYLDVSEADMEKGQMRIEANLSLSQSRDQLGTKVEIKNLNSFWAVQEAIEYEIKRQTKILNENGKIHQETRGFDANKKKTFLQREKEFAQDYRYFPEPDLPVFFIPEELISKIEKEIPALPSAERKRLKELYQLKDFELEVLIKNNNLKNFFENNLYHLKELLKKENSEQEIRFFSNYFFTEFLSFLKTKQEKEGFLEKIGIKFGELIFMVLEKKLNSFLTKKIIKEFLDTLKDPVEIFQFLETQEETTPSLLNEVIQEVIKENPKAVEDFKKGKTSALQFLVGQTMKKTKGKFDPQSVAKEISNLLG